MYRPASNPATLAKNAEMIRRKRLACPLFWEHNATLHREPVFAQACLNYARKLRNG